MPTPQIVELIGSARAAKAAVQSRDVLRLGVTALAHFAESHSIGIVVVQPHFSCDRGELYAWRSRQPSGWLTVLCVDQTQPGARRALEWLRDWPIPLLVAPSSLAFAPQALSPQILSPVTNSCAIVPDLVTRLGELPIDFALHAAGVFASPFGAGSLKALAGQTGMSPRHARRLLKASGIRSSHLFFSASRVLRVFDFVRDGSPHLTQLAARFGFGTVRTLRREWNAVLGEDLPESDWTDAFASRVRLVAERVFSS